MFWRTLSISLWIGFITLGTAWSQPAVPTRPLRMQELITLTRDTPVDQALWIIQELSGQVIVDPQHMTAPIGVAVDRQPWRRALYQIAEHHGLEVWQRERYFELLPKAKNAAEVREAGTAATLDSREVVISAVFFQADRSALREFGIDWSTLSGGRVDVRAAHLGAQQVAANQFAVGAHANVNRSLSIDVLLKALEKKQVGEIVANPQIKVQNGKTGYIQVGSDFSVTTADFAGNAITQFFSTGTILTVKPRILSQESVDFVDLEVEAERSALIDPVRNLINKTVARTSALLKNQERTAIGGLYGQEVIHARSGVPILKDLPGWFFGLRHLFGSDSRQVNKTELIVLLKVDIVPTVRERVELGDDAEAHDIIQNKQRAFDDLIESYRK